MQEIQLFSCPEAPSELVVAATLEAIALRDALMDNALSFDHVPVTSEENDLLTECGNAIQAQIKGTEKVGLELRRPFNRDSDKIKRVQDAYLDPLRPHLKRLSSFSATFRANEERKAEAERRRRAEEIIRLQEQERKAAEDARKAAEAGNLVAELQADIQTDALKAATDAAIAAPPPEAITTRGQSFRADDFDFEVTDINALWASRPDLCNGPTAKRSAIKACCGVTSQIPGLRFFPKPTVNFKAAR